MRTLVREDRVGQSARVPAVTPVAAPGSDDWWREPLNASKWEMPPKMNSPSFLRRQKGRGRTPRRMAARGSGAIYSKRSSTYRPRGLTPNLGWSEYRSSPSNQQVATQQKTAILRYVVSYTTITTDFRFFLRWRLERRGHTRSRSEHER